MCYFINYLFNFIINEANDEPSIKQEIDISPNVKVENTKKEFVYSAIHSGESTFGCEICAKRFAYIMLV